MTFVRDVVLTQVLGHTGLEDLQLTIEFAMIASYALVGAVAWAYEAIYDARLYAALNTGDV